MNIEVPEFLLELSKQMNENDKRSTAFPFWQVRQKEYLITAEGYNEHHWEIVSDDGVCLHHSELNDNFDDLAVDLFEECEEWCKQIYKYYDGEDYGEFSYDHWRTWFSDWYRNKNNYEDLPDGYTKYYLQEVEKVLTTHLTKEDAEWFIARKKHDYPNAYTYVESAYWSPQFKELQDWIRALTGGKSGA